VTTIIPEGEALRKAIKWISEQREKEPDIKVQKWVDKASLTFDLSPKDEAFLYRFYKK